MIEKDIKEDHDAHVGTHIRTYKALVKGYENEWSFMVIKFVFFGLPGDPNYLCTRKFIVFLMLILKQILKK